MPSSPNDEPTRLKDAVTELMRPCLTEESARRNARPRELQFKGRFLEISRGYHAIVKFNETELGEVFRVDEMQQKRTILIFWPSDEIRRMSQGEFQRLFKDYGENNRYK